ncbi:hypothetical protein EJ06DRAFT_534607 [Trichodelitschia bisporula]|uniref:Uncharacterized protein n=1 Tax=Trichodelitschia bisporula TaxID=703511 RepID=A0A6G1HIN5_9PEZI|nr:hypothetical protein EJ06DRAFT_534607 [Trichodelitschia bisporula]
MSTASFRIPRNKLQILSLLPKLPYNPTFEFATWASLSEKAVTVTPSRPYRGIWAGDYHGRGEEFLVLLQLDAPI